MRQYFKYILFLVSIVVTVGCSIDSLEPSPIHKSKDDNITIVGRITSFTDCDVMTRGVKEDKETHISSMAIAIFPVGNDNSLGDCAYYQYMPSSELIFNIERGIYTKNSRYAIYILANMPYIDTFDKSMSLEEMLNKAIYSVESVDIPENGFPMIGSIGDNFSTDFDNDGRILILAPTVDGTNNTDITNPKVGTTLESLTEQSMLTVPLKALYAKINFTIVVDPDQVIQGNNLPQFTLEGYTINNIPSSVDFLKSTNSDSEVIEVINGAPVTGNIQSTGVSEKIEFSFYLPERLLQPKADYTYPFTKQEDILKYRQRYKSQLLETDQKATNIVISGKFRDHQEHFFDLHYTIHLGGNEYNDFNILRNSEYNNFVTIRGIQASDDKVENKVFVDHRVNIEHTQPGVISLHREVLLDSHFEIRPLRIKKNAIIGTEASDITHVQVEVVNPVDLPGQKGTTWMRIERSYGDGSYDGSPMNKNGECVYIHNEVQEGDPIPASNGKRRYFTYDLVTGTGDGSLGNSTSVVVPLNEVGECVWIYVDECTEVGDDVRSGEIQLQYGSLDGSKFIPTQNSNYPVIKYSINQRKLFKVEKDSRSYHIEYEEEYLHNFDSEENYGETEEEGMTWGLEGIQLSYDYEALYFKAKTGDWANGIVDYFTGEVPAYYDFYIKRHDESRMADPKQVTLHEFAGFTFCKEIIEEVNGGGSGNDKENTANDIKNLALNQKPKSAVEYCYNKNKRDAEGLVRDVDCLWYLPAIDEMEDIVTSTYDGTNDTYARFKDFQNKFYWSSQPSYIQNFAHMQWTLIIIPLDYYGSFYYDDIGNTQYDLNDTSKQSRANIGSARATKVSYEYNENTAQYEYNYATSGTNGYYSYYDASASAEEKYKYDGTVRDYWNGVNVTIGAITREEGNLARNSMARVRCVRRQSDQQQQ